MLHKSKQFFILSTFLVTVFLIATTHQENKWKGTIEEENGIRVIKNPIEPLYGEIAFELEEDLSIGNESDDNYMFYRVFDVCADEAGNIYVLEFGNYRVQKFDRNGKYLKTVGRQGQGPGEFEGPVRVIVDKKTGEIHVKDRTWIKVFNTDGDFIKSINFKNYLYDFILDDSQNIWGMVSISTESYPLHAFAKLNDQGDIEKEIAKFPFEWTQSKSGDNVMVLTTDEEHDISILHTDGNMLIYGFSKEYKLNVIDQEGKTLYIIAKDEPPKNFTAQELKKYDRGRVKINLPSYKRYFYNLYTDSVGRIYVQRDMGRRYASGKIEYDIFSKDGYYLYKTILLHSPLFIDNGFFYTRTENEESGEELVKRFKIKNWDQMKKGIN